MGDPTSGAHEGFCDQRQGLKVVPIDYGESRQKFLAGHDNVVKFVFLEMSPSLLLIMSGKKTRWEALKSFSKIDKKRWAKRRHLRSDKRKIIYFIKTLRSKNS